MNKFAGKTAVISGGAEGIGLSIAKAMGAQNMNIVLTDINKDMLETAASKLSKSGVSVLAVVLDVSQESQWQAVADQAIKRFGKIHMLVNNAGVTGDGGPIEQQDAKGWQWALEVNLMGVVYGAKIMVPHIKAHGEGGWVVNVASMAGLGGVPYGGVYTATKSAVVALSEGWAVELQEDDIHVSVLCPGFVKTRIHESSRNRPARYASDDSGQQARSDSPVSDDRDQDSANPFEKSANPFKDSAKQFVENGIDVSIVGERLLEALIAKEMFVFTHPDYRGVLQKRANIIDTAFENAARSPLLQGIVGQKL